MAASVGRPPGISSPSRDVNHGELCSATINILGNTDLTPYSFRKWKNTARTLTIADIWH
jgi:hypothetical protein